MIEKYNRTFTFYGLSLLIPWVLWFIVAYLSHLPQQSSTILTIQQVLSLTGLAAPLLVALVLILSNRELIIDFKSRFFNIRQYNHVYTFLAIFLIFIAIVFGQLISVFFGHSPDQFYVSGNPLFSSALFSPWVFLIAAPVLEEFAWHCYGTDTLRRRMNLFATHPDSKVIQTALLLIVAVTVLIRDREMFFNKEVLDNESESTKPVQPRCNSGGIFFFHGIR